MSLRNDGGKIERMKKHIDDMVDWMRKIIVLHVRHANYQIGLTYLTNDDETYLALLNEAK